MLGHHISKLQVLPFFHPHHRLETGTCHWYSCCNNATADSQAIALAQLLRVAPALGAPIPIALRAIRLRGIKTGKLSHGGINTLVSYIIGSHQYNNIYIYINLYLHTRSTARGGGGSFKNRKPIGEIGCCESRMAEQKHSWIELSSCLTA